MLRWMRICMTDGLVRHHRRRRRGLRRTRMAVQPVGMSRGAGIILISSRRAVGRR
jgi:hypothetical protein